MIYKRMEFVSKHASYMLPSFPHSISNMISFSEIAKHARLISSPIRRSTENSTTLWSNHFDSHQEYGQHEERRSFPKKAHILMTIRRWESKWFNQSVIEPAVDKLWWLPISLTLSAISEYETTLEMEWVKKGSIPYYKFRLSSMPSNKMVPRFKGRVAKWEGDANKASDANLFRCHVTSCRAISVSWRGEFIIIFLPHSRSRALLKPPPRLVNGYSHGLWIRKGRNIWQFLYMAPLIAKRHMAPLLLTPHPPPPLPLDFFVSSVEGTKNWKYLWLEYERRLEGWRGKFWKHEMFIS